MNTQAKTKPAISPKCRQKEKDDTITQIWIRIGSPGTVEGQKTAQEQMMKMNDQRDYLHQSWQNKCNIKSPAHTKGLLIGEGIAFRDS